MIRHASLIALLTLAACSKPAAEPPPPPPPWEPGTVTRLDRAPSARGYTELRGLIHAHSIYSHDACDGAPQDGGVYNAQCLADFRRGLCQAQHDFVFLTDHRDSFDGNEFPDVLLHDAAQGDTLVLRDAGPSANWLACPGSMPALIMAGTETSPMMPVGLERHVAGPGIRGGLYGSDKPEDLDAMHTVGGVTLVAHTEGWTPEQLVALPLDGFEMFNLHRNALKNAGVIADLLFNYVEKGAFDTLPHPDLFLMAFTLDDDVYLKTWGTTLARGVKRVTTMGSDCHRNSFPQLLQDGERVDSYRRMMSAFSNHLLVKTKADGSWDDRDLKDALKAGRNFGVFEFMGYQEGFDVVALEGDVPHELGETVSLGKGVTLTATMPKVRGLDPAGEQPMLTLKVWRAKEGGWDEVASSAEATLTVPLTQVGAYRVEVRMVPRHLKPWIGKRSTYLKDERPWVYTSALYVGP